MKSSMMTTEKKGLAFIYMGWSSEPQIWGDSERTTGCPARPWWGLPGGGEESGVWFPSFFNTTIRDEAGGRYSSAAWQDRCERSNGSF